MLIAQNCGGLRRLAAALVLAGALVACSNQGPPAPSPRATSPAQSVAADLRTHLDLLLGEQVMIVAKESAAAVNHSDEYAAYTSLLATNSADLTNLVGRAYGNTAAAQFAQLWNAQNGFLVDYAIGVVIHNDDKAKGAINSLNSTFVPQFSQLLHSLSKLATDPLTLLNTQQVGDDKAVIDAVFAGDFKSYYAGLHTAYQQTSRLGDALAAEITADFPDRFPGDVSAAAVSARVALNLDLQEHSYLATMATDATVNARDAERSEALRAVATNLDALRSAVQDQRFTLALAQEGTILQGHAANTDPTAQQSAVAAFVTELASITRVPRGVILNHVDVAIRVVDDQRGNAKAVAGDDRAAATSTEPIGDALAS